MVKKEDVIIIGGGIASHTAALYTARANLKPIVISSAEPDQLSLTTLVENYPGFPAGIMGPDLIKNCKEQAQKFSANYIQGIVDSFKVKKGYYEVGLGKKRFNARSVIISTGASARRLHVKGEDKYFGKGISTCAVCLPPEESVIINSSIKKIKDVNPLTRVLTIDGTYQSITGFMKRKYKGKLVKIRPRFFNEAVSLTPNHPVLTVKALRDHSHGKYINFTKSKWVEAGKLKKGDCVLYPILKEIKDTKEIKISDYIDVKVRNNYAYPAVETHTSNNVPNAIEMDKDFMRLIGYYIAEGSSYKHMLSLYFNKNEREYVNDVVNILKDKFKLKPEVKYKGNVCRITIYSKVLADLFKNLFGAYAYQKKLPHWAVVLPISKQKELVKGLWRGDGCIREEDFCYVTSSRELAYQLRDVLLRLGIIPSVQLRDKDKLNKWINKIEGRLVGFNYNKYHINVGGQFLENISNVLNVRHPFLDKRKYICRHAWIKDDFAILPIREIEKVNYNGIVLNLGVENNNTYVAKNLLVHNCDAALYKDKAVIVIGGGDSAMEEALALYKFAKKITIVHRRDKFRASKIMQDRIFKLKGKINIIWDSQPVEVLGDGRFVTGAKIKNVKTGKESIIKCDGVFLAIGHNPNTKVFAGKVNLDKFGYIKTNERGWTNLPGVFAGGDVQDYIYKQAVTSAGTGCMAAMEAEKYIESLKATKKYK